MHLHHLSRATPLTPQSTSTNRLSSSTIQDEDPQTSRFIRPVVHLTRDAHTFGASTAPEPFPRHRIQPPQLCFPAASSHRNASTFKGSSYEAKAYTTPKKRLYIHLIIFRFIFMLISQNITSNYTTMLKLTLCFFPCSSHIVVHLTRAAPKMDTSTAPGMFRGGLLPPHEICFPATCGHRITIPATTHK